MNVFFIFLQKITVNFSDKIEYKFKDDPEMIFESNRPNMIINGIMSNMQYTEFVKFR